MTPPQPAPRDTPIGDTSDAEMSVRDLVDASDEGGEEVHGPGQDKPAPNGQVLVDPEDLQAADLSLSPSLISVHAQSCANSNSSIVINSGVGCSVQVHVDCI